MVTEGDEVGVKDVEEDGEGVGDGPRLGPGLFVLDGDPVFGVG